MMPRDERRKTNESTCPFNNRQHHILHNSYCLSASLHSGVNVSIVQSKEIENDSKL